jgi:hypothetical protein
MNLDSAILLTPHKLGNVTPFTREMSQSSNFETIVRQVLGEAIGLAIDTELFSTNAADGSRPGGILLGVAALSGSS